MNEHLTERFGRSKRGAQKRPGTQAEVLLLPPKLNPRVREYYEVKPGEADTGRNWLQRPEIPTAAELLDQEPDESRSNGSSEVVEIASNKPAGAFKSKEDYLATQYELMREDALKFLKKAVSWMRVVPEAVEDSLVVRSASLEGIKQQARNFARTC